LLRKNEEHAIDALELQYEELRSLRGENRDVKSDLEALHEELENAVQTHLDRKKYIVDLQDKMFEFDGEIEQKKKRLAELARLL
jgi:peptidoglycan hydrolase CwlO-like protein